MLINNIKVLSNILLTSLFLLSFNTSFAASIEGFWKSEGYSNVLFINNTELKIFELTKVSCVSKLVYPIKEIYQEYEPIIISDNGQEMSLHLKNSMNKYEYKRIKTLPPLCLNGGTPDSFDPLVNFDILWHTFNENYAFFDIREVDWNVQYALYRPQISSATTELELFNIFKSMLAPLEDGHVNLLSSDRTQYFSGEETRVLDYQKRIMDEYTLLNPGIPVSTYFEKQIKLFNTIISDQYLKNNVQSDTSKLISWGKIKNRIGYISIKQMFGFSGADDGAKDLQALTKIMDVVMADLQDVNAIVIDVRSNEGGFDEAGFKIASRFTDKIRPVLIKKAVSNEGYSDEIIFKINPEGQYAYIKPVFVLFNEDTASAAEVFLLAMKTLPNVTLIGEHSNGVFSDVLDRNLANSMKFTLSNEVYSDMDGISYEKIGIQPDIPIAFLMKTDRDNGIDSAIEKVISLTP